MSKRVLIVAALLPIAGVAHAQDASGGGVTGAETAVAANVSVADRPRPDYAPVGGRIGSFYLYPTLETNVQYNSNLRASTTGQLSDVSVQIRPAVQVVSNWTRNQLQLNAFYQRTIHGRYSTEDFGQYGADGAGQIYVGPNTTMNLIGSVGRLTEPRTDINSVNATRAPIGYTNLAFSGSISQSFAAFTVTASGGVTKQTFSNAVLLDGTPLLQTFRDNSAFNASLEGRYRVGAGTSLIAYVGRQSIAYDQNPFSGFDRNSSSVRAELGVGLALSRLLYGDVRVGYFKQKNNDARFLNSSGISFSANLLYSLTPLTSIRLNADRSIEPGGSTFTSGNLRSTGSLTIDHELRRNIVLTGYGRYSHVEPQASTIAFGTADEYEGRLGVKYYLNRRFRVTGDVSYFKRSSVTFSSVNVALASFGVIVAL